MGVDGKRRNAAREQKVALNRWRGYDAKWLRRMNVCKVRPSVLRAGPILYVGPLEKQWAPDRGPRLFTCGQRLEAVVTDPRRGVGASCGSYAFQKFCEENRTTFDLSGVVSVDPTSTLRTSLDPAVTTQSSVSPPAELTVK